MWGVSFFGQCQINWTVNDILVGKTWFVHTIAFLMFIQHLSVWPLHSESIQHSSRVTVWNPVYSGWGQLPIWRTEIRQKSDRRKKDEWNYRHGHVLQKLLVYQRYLVYTVHGSYNRASGNRSRLFEKKNVYTQDDTRIHSGSLSYLFQYPAMKLHNTHNVHWLVSSVRCLMDTH